MALLFSLSTLLPLFPEAVHQPILALDVNPLQIGLHGLARFPDKHGSTTLRGRGSPRIPRGSIRHDPITDSVRKRGRTDRNRDRTFSRLDQDPTTLSPGFRFPCGCGLGGRGRGFGGCGPLYLVLELLVVSEEAKEGLWRRLVFVIVRWQIPFPAPGGCGSRWLRKTRTHKIPRWICSWSFVKRVTRLDLLMFAHSAHS